MSKRKAAQKPYTPTTPSRVSFQKFPLHLEVPDLLSIQLDSFREFFSLDTPPEKQSEEGLYKVFQEFFPVRDAHEEYQVDFLGYVLEPPRHSPEECKSRGITYGVNLRVRLRLYPLKVDNMDFEPVEEYVYLGVIPYMTDRGTFVVNGVERVVVNQLHRSPGILFSARQRSGTNEYIYGARVIPQKGTWIEFATDNEGRTRIYFDRKKGVAATIFLRAMGYGSDGEILSLFDLAEKVKVSRRTLTKYIGRKLAARVKRIFEENTVDTETGEVIPTQRSEDLFEMGHILTQEDIDVILERNVVDTIYVQKENVDPRHVVLATLQEDSTYSQTSACKELYFKLFGQEAGDDESARNQIEKRLFSDQRRYDLGPIGRYQINRKLYGNQEETAPYLTVKDIVAILNYIYDMMTGIRQPDEEDHLAHRRIRTVGEQMALQFSTGLQRLTRSMREKIGTYESNEHFRPSDIVNPRALTAVLNSFFMTGQLSQLLDQTNPLSELSHKRRISALGPGGLSREHAGFEARDVHYSHYGRICPIETPEGANIGLISTLSIFARTNEYGFLITPYYKVQNGKIDYSSLVYLPPDEEEKSAVAPALSVQEDREEIQVRLEGDFPEVPKTQVQYVDVAPYQVLGLSASLIPFLEHDDANRALMGSNMQRQAVPLLRPEAPIVGTGIEKHVAKDARVLIYAEYDGEVVYVDGEEIHIRYEMPLEEQLVSFEGEYRVYKIPKFRRTNENTCINLRPIVRSGDKVQKGQPLVEGYSIEGGEIALGKNLLVAFMPWKGYNFEDAIVISSRLIYDDVLTSIHIAEYEVEVRETKLGPEELTREIPNESENRLAHLDEEGIVVIGTEVKEGQILVGKVTPKGEQSDPSPEEKLLRAIFGERSGDVKNTSLIMPPATQGYVIDRKLYSRKSGRARNLEDRNRKEKEIERTFELELGQLNAIMAQKLHKILHDIKLCEVKNKLGKRIIKAGTKPTESLLRTLVFHELVPLGWTEDEKTNLLVEKLFQNYMQRYNRLLADKERELYQLKSGDELQTDILKLAKVYVASKRKIRVGDKLAGRHGNKGVIAKIAAIEDMPYLEDGTPVDIVLNPLGVPSRMNVGQIYETILGWAGKKLGVKFETPPFSGATYEEVNVWLEKAGLPRDGRVYLLDGESGERFAQPATVGVIYMLKLDHMVDDKMHARAVGPYGVVTAQPLGGKSHFGGQRLGEMEAWALEAFGASSILQEMLTIKSDDIEGRTKAHEAIVRGEDITYYGIPESFNVLIHELRGLCLDVELE
ncbi:MAG: DNA-directed RNA polymerase subunit beta [Bacteroidia bacterium]